MNFSRLLPLCFLSTGLLLSSIAESAEARRGSRGSGRESADVDLTYTFSVFDTDIDEVPIAGCAIGSNTCLFGDAVSDLTIDQLDYLTSGTLDEVFIGSSNQSLFAQTYNPGLGFDEYSDDFILDLSFPSSSLSLLSEWDGSTLNYTITDRLGEAIQATGTFSGRNPDEPLSRTLRAFSITSTGARPDDRLINSIDYIVDTLRGEVALESGFELQAINSDGENTPFSPVDTVPTTPTEVPEPSSLLGLIAFSLLGIKVSKQSKLEAKEV